MLTLAFSSTYTVHKYRPQEVFACLYTPRLKSDKMILLPEYLCKALFFFFFKLSWNLNISSCSRPQVGGGNLLVRPRSSGRSLAEEMRQILRRGSSKNQILLQQGKLLSKQNEADRQESSLRAIERLFSRNFSAWNIWKTVATTCDTSWVCFVQLCCSEIKKQGSLFSSAQSSTLRLCDETMNQSDS